MDTYLCSSPIYQILLGNMEIYYLIRSATNIKIHAIFVLVCRQKRIFAKCAYQKKIFAKFAAIFSLVLDICIFLTGHIHTDKIMNCLKLDSLFISSFN